MPNQTSYSLISGISDYPFCPPFNPSERYPEYPFEIVEGKGTNSIYEGVRRALRELNLDLEHYGTREWNPLGVIVKPGGKVVIKPNLVRDFHETDGNIYSIMTHASVIRAIVDYVSIALKGKGSIAIADAPHCDSGPFENLLGITGLDKMQEFYYKNGLEVKIYDLRIERAIVKERRGLILKRIPLRGDPMGYVKVNLGERSFFTETENLSQLLCGSDYDFEETRTHHSRGRHEYLISKTVLDSDLIISIPKLKTHKRAGITLNLKNMIGVNGDKNYIPHYRAGSVKGGGDEFPYHGLLRETEGKVKGLLLPKLFVSKGLTLECARLLRRVHKYVIDKTGFASIRSGAWHGNDTLWRAILDINQIVLFGDAEGVIHREHQRKYLSLVDGVIAGEGEGPLNPTEKHCGFLIAGFSPFIVDAIGAYLMGFRLDELPDLRECFGDDSRMLLQNINVKEFLNNVKEKVPNLMFNRWRGWKV
jgi:uncharacterized protein (DUF362 family)